MQLDAMLYLRIAQGVFAFIDLVLLSYVSNWWTGHWHEISPHEVNFLISATVWSFLAIAYQLFVPNRFPHAAHKYASPGVDLFLALYWFAGFIALAAFLGDRVCFGSVCNIARAGVAFGAFEWVLFASSTGFAAYKMWSNRGHGRTEGNLKTEMQQQRL